MLYRFADCEIDARLYQLRRDGTQVSIEPRVFDVLIYLLTNRERVISKDELFDKLWPGQVVTETALTRCIVVARKAVGDDGTKQEIIETQHGRGYRFVGKVVSSQYSVDSREEENQKTVLSPSASFRINSVEGSKVEDGRAGFARQKWAMIATTSLVLIATTIGIVHYWPSSTPHSQLRTPNLQSLTPNPQPLPLPDKPSINILPFTNLSGDTSQEYFSDGLTDGIITELSRIPELFVIAQQSAFAYKGKQMRVQEIGREVGVRYVLEGSVQKITGRLRIFAQLSDTTTGEQLWAERYDLELSDTMTVQEQIRQKIAALHNLGIEQMKN